MKNKKVKQESFHVHFVKGVHQGGDWEIRSIDQGESVDNVRQREVEVRLKWPFFNSTLFHISLFILFSDKPTTSIPI